MNSLKLVTPSPTSCLHLLERALVDVGDDHVERVVDRAVALGLGVPGVEALAQRAAHRWIAKSTIVVVPPHAAARVPVSNVSDGVRAAEGHLHVGVAVDAAGDDVLAGRVDHACRPSSPAPVPSATTFSSSISTSTASSSDAVMTSPPVIRACGHLLLDDAAVLRRHLLDRGDERGQALLGLRRASASGVGRCAATLPCRPPLPISRPRRFVRLQHGVGEVGRRVAGRRRPRPHQLDADHQALAADVADDRRAADRAQPVEQDRRRPARRCPGGRGRAGSAGWPARPPTVSGEPPNVEIELAPRSP